MLVTQLQPGRVEIEFDLDEEPQSHLCRVVDDELVVEKAMVAILGCHGRTQGYRDLLAGPAVQIRGLQLHVTRGKNSQGA